VIPRTRRHFADVGVRGRWAMRLQTLACLTTIALGAGCGEPGPVPGVGDDDAITAPHEGVYAVPDAIKRPYWLHIPEAGEGAPRPLLIALHRNGGRFETLRRLSCRDADTNSHDCLAALADREGFVLVMPNGTNAILLEGTRSWNAGGGEGSDVACVSGRACDESVDDVSYIDTVIAEVSRATPIDPARIYVTGMSAGGAMAHRLACERSTVFAAVVSVAGGNQVQGAQGCFPARPIPILQISGDKDPCWGMDGSTRCLGDRPGTLVSIEETFEGWRQLNGCSAVVDTSDVADNVVGRDVGDDPTSAVRRAWTNCRDDVATEMIVIEGGGHAWPGGFAYAGPDSIGVTSTRLVANDLIWDFMKRHTLPSVLLPEDGAAQ
jgi:polyhydroxybutyrate depolymerase